MSKKDYVGTPEYEQGRSAFRGSISRDEAPHGEGNALDAWNAGYDYEKGLHDLSAPRESTEGDVEEVKRLSKEGGAAKPEAKSKQSHSIKDTADALKGKND